MGNAVTSPPDAGQLAASDASAVEHAAATAGAVFGLITLLGFIPGITVNIWSLGLVGMHTTTLLLGVFTVSLLHNVIHLLFAIGGLRFARTARTARRYLLTVGAIFLVLALYGFLLTERGVADVLPINRADDWLHLAVGVALIALAPLPTRRKRRKASPA
jgi:Domain of unknown function (DUF4383)